MTTNNNCNNILIHWSSNVKTELGPRGENEITKVLKLQQRGFEYCITLYFRGRKISRKENLKYFREKIFSRIYCSRENIFPRKYLPAKISSRENILSRKYLAAKIVCLFRQRSFLFAVCCPVIGDTGSRPS